MSTVLLPKPIGKPGDWPEDFSHENGNYLCRCCHCHETFTGHKRRVVCKVCATRDQEEAKRRAEWLHAHNAPKNWVILTIDEVQQMHGEASRLVMELHVERNLRRDLDIALTRLMGCISETRGSSAYYALEDARKVTDQSAQLDAEIAARAAAKVKS